MTEHNPTRDNSLFPNEKEPLRNKVEAILFAAPKPMDLQAVHAVLNDPEILLKDLAQIVHDLMGEYRQRSGGIELASIKGHGYQFRTTPQMAGLMEQMFSQRPRPLSRAAQETLAIIAYRQPVTRADIEFIRGVDAGSILKNLLEKELICCTGRKDIAGKPMTFGTTDEFLRTYQLAGISDLPPLESFQPATDLVGEALKKIETHTEQEPAQKQEAAQEQEAELEAVQEQQAELEAVQEQQAELETRTENVQKQEPRPVQDKQQKKVTESRQKPEEDDRTQWPKPKKTRNHKEKNSAVDPILTI